ncbi:hypothetical protein GCM10010353_67950 [Streptomyces chryseus]|nr:hypothetical protein GCM10010353_67950 [Streptomyces chryseus]
MAAGSGVVDGDRKDDLHYVGGDSGQVDLDDLVVSLALAGEVVAGVLDRAVRADQVVEEDEVLVGRDFSGFVDHQRTGIEVVVGAGRRTDVPAQADQDGGQPRRLLAQRDIAALGQAHTHVASLLEDLGPRTGRRFGPSYDTIRNLQQCRNA